LVTTPIGRISGLGYLTHEKEVYRNAISGVRLLRKPRGNAQFRLHGAGKRSFTHRRRARHAGSSVIEDIALATNQGRGLSLLRCFSGKQGLARAWDGDGGVTVSRVITARARVVSPEVTAPGKPHPGQNKKGKKKKGD